MAFHAFFGVALLGGTTVLAQAYWCVRRPHWGRSPLADQRYGGGDRLGHRRAPDPRPGGRPGGPVVPRDTRAGPAPRPRRRPGRRRRAGDVQRDARPAGATTALTRSPQSSVATTDPRVAGTISVRRRTRCRRPTSADTPATQRRATPDLRPGDAADAVPRPRRLRRRCLASTGLALAPDGSAARHVRRHARRRAPAYVTRSVGGRRRTASARPPADPQRQGRVERGVPAGRHLLFISARPDPDSATEADDASRPCGCSRGRGR